MILVQRAIALTIAHHVVSVEDASLLTILDGFTVIDGQADGSGESSFESQEGGGIEINNSDGLSLNNLIVANNFADFHGGGIFQQSSNTNFTNIAFLNNTTTSEALESGGAIYSSFSPTTIANALFVNNQAYSGGAISVVGNDLLSNEFNIINSTFVDNQANVGAAIHDDFFWIHLCRQYRK